MKYINFCFIFSFYKKNLYFFRWMLLLLSFSLTGCGGIICKGQNKKGEKQTVVFDYDPILETVDIGGAPTYVRKYEWVKKIIVQPKGFLIVFDQKTAGFKPKPCDDDKSKLCQKHTITSNYYVQSYTEKKGYKYWSYVPEKDWIRLANIEDEPPQAPYFQAGQCRFSLFGGLLELLLAIAFA